MPATLQLGFRTGAAPRRSPDGQARLLLMGDFSGRAAGDATDPAGLANRATYTVDIDNFDAVMKRLEPQLPLSSDGRPQTMHFRSLDDFHPDRLMQADAALGTLLSQRRRLLDPTQFAQAAREMAAPAAPATPVASPTAASAEDDRSMLSRLMGSSARGTAPAPGESAAGRVAALLRSVLSARDLAPELPFQAQYLAVVDDAASTALRALQHRTELQQLEAAWRGAHLLVSNLDLGEDLELHLLDVCRAELEQGGQALARRFASLAEATTDAGAAWSLAGLITAFDASEFEVTVLENLGLAASHLGAPLVASASARLAGVDLPSGEWRPLAPAEQARWMALRKGPAAKWLGLAAPRLLLRLPYGPRRDAIESFAYDELAGAQPHAGELLWGDAALACLLHRGRVETGSDAGDAREIAELPALTYTVDGEKQLQPAAETVLGDRAAAQVLAHGVMPLQGSRHRNAVRLLRWQTLAG